MALSGFLFLFILVLFVAMAAFGKLETGAIIEISDDDLDAKLQKFNNAPNKFQISMVLSLIHNLSVIALPIMLFIVFSPYNILLGIVWTTFRIGEGLILIYNDINYRGLLNIARQYSVASGTEKNSLSDFGRTIFLKNSSRFTFGMVLWAIGTLAYSILFVIYGVVPPIIGWLGIVASIFVGFYNGIKLVKPNIKGVLITFLSIGALLAILFELIIGGWLLFFGIITP